MTDCPGPQTVRFLHDTLAKDGYRVVVLHGERSQPERDEALRSFRGGKSQVFYLAHVNVYKCVVVLHGARSQTQLSRRRPCVASRWSLRIGQGTSPF